MLIKTVLYGTGLQLGRHVVPLLVLAERPLDASH